MENYPKDNSNIDNTDALIRKMIEETSAYDKSRLLFNQEQEERFDSILEEVSAERDQLLEEIYPVLSKYGLFPDELDPTNYDSDLITMLAFDTSHELHDFAYYATHLLDACSTAAMERERQSVKGDEFSALAVSDIQADVASVALDNPDKINWVKASMELLGDLSPIPVDRIGGDIEPEVGILESLAIIASVRSREAHQGVAEVEKYVVQELKSVYGDHSEIEEIASGITFHSIFRAVQKSEQDSTKKTEDTYRSLFADRSIRLDYDHLAKVAMSAEAKLREFDIAAFIRNEETQ